MTPAGRYLAFMAASNPATHEEMRRHLFAELVSVVTDEQWDAAFSRSVEACTKAVAWTCEAHRISVTGDCPRCDDELITLHETAVA